MFYSMEEEWGDSGPLWQGEPIVVMKGYTTCLAYCAEVGVGPMIY